MIAALQDIRNAYDARDRDALERALERIEQAMRYTGPLPRRQVPVTNDERVSVPGVTHCRYCDQRVGTVHGEYCRSRGLPVVAES